MSRHQSPRTAHGVGGQGLVEYALIVPLFLLILVGMLEFGFLFDQAMTLNYATREGARGGSSFAKGNATTLPCADVDKNIIAAVERVLDAPGSRVDKTQVGEIVIYKANAAGTLIGGNRNRWVFADDGGPAVDGVNLDFREAASGWSACGRVNDWAGTPQAPIAPDSIGVSVSYTYRFVTPLAAIVGFFGPAGTASIQISDRTVMALNPTTR